jgi:hypothetical protein
MCLEMKDEPIEDISGEFSYIEAKDRPIDPDTGKPMEMGKRGNSYQDMLFEIMRKKASGELETTNYNPKEGSSKGSSH